MFVDLLNTLQTSTQEPLIKALKVGTTSSVNNLTPPSEFAANLQSQLDKSTVSTGSVAYDLPVLPSTLVDHENDTGADVSGHNLPVQGSLLPLSAPDLISGEPVEKTDIPAVPRVDSARPESSTARGNLEIMPEKSVGTMLSSEPKPVLMVAPESEANEQVTARPSREALGGADYATEDVASSPVTPGMADGLDQVVEQRYVQIESQVTPSSVPLSAGPSLQANEAVDEPVESAAPVTPDKAASHRSEAPLSKTNSEAVLGIFQPRDDKSAFRTDMQPVSVAEKGVRAQPVKMDAAPERAIEIPLRKPLYPQYGAPLPRIETSLTNTSPLQPNLRSEQIPERSVDRQEFAMKSVRGVPRPQANFGSASGLLDPALRAAPEKVPAQAAESREAVSQSLTGVARSIDYLQPPSRTVATDIPPAKQGVPQAPAFDRVQQTLTEEVQLRGQTAPKGAPGLSVERPDAQGAPVAQTWQRSAGYDERLTINRAPQRVRDGGMVRAETTAAMADSRPLERILADQLFVQPARPAVVVTDAPVSNSSFHAQTTQDAALTQREQLAQNVQAQLQAQITRAMTRQALMQGRISIQLNPVELGAVDLDFTTERGEIQIVMVAREMATRELLDAGLARLRLSLQEAGLAVSSVDIRHEDSGAARRDARHGPDDDSQRRKASPSTRDEVEIDPALPAQIADRTDGFHAYA